MTKEQKVQAYAMILDGVSVSDVAREFGVSRQRICEIFHVSNIRLEMAADSCVYPNISKWMRKNHEGYTSIARKAGMYTERIRLALTGENVHKSVIDAILAVTEMTYEEAFKK